jgi:hypothetical protein
MRAPDPLGAHTSGLGAVARAALDAGASLGSLLDQVRRSALRVGIATDTARYPVRPGPCGARTRRWGTAASAPPSLTGRFRPASPSP